jgi:hypothetical protein
MAENNNSDIGKMFLFLAAGYGLAQYQNHRRQQGQVCYSTVTNTTSLPDSLADKAEEVIRAGGQAGVRKVGALLELLVQNAAGDTTIFRQVQDAVGGGADAYDTPMTGARRRSGGAPEVEVWDEATQTWRVKR